MSETQWGIRNLELAGLFDKDSDYGGMVGEAVKKLLEIHQAEGHSGFSHIMVVTLFYKVAKGEALTLKYWQERFDEYQEMSRLNNAPLWTEENFIKITGITKPAPESPIKENE
jgi:hypothetical protein